MTTKIRLLFTALVFSNIAMAQNQVKMTSDYGSENVDIQNIIDFENIYIDKLNFESTNLKGKFIKISIDEYKNGRFKKTATLFDGTESEFFKIDSDKESLKFFFKMADGKLKTYIRGQKFGSKKTFFPLSDVSEKYALKDFYGNKKELSLDISKKNAVFAIITPTIHKDGTGSYCEASPHSICCEFRNKLFSVKNKISCKI